MGYIADGSSAEVDYKKMLCYINQQPLERFFTLSLIAHALDLHDTNQSFNDIIAPFIAYRLVQEYNDQSKNSGLNISIITLCQIVNKMAMLNYSLKEALIRIFALNPDANKTEDLWDNFEKKLKIFQQDVEEKLLLQGEELFKKSFFARIPELFFEENIPNDFGLVRPPIMGKVAALWFGNSKRNEVLSLIKKAGANTTRFNPSTYSGWLSGLKFGNIFRKIISTPEYPPIQQANYIPLSENHKSIFKKMLALYPSNSNNS